MLMCLFDFTPPNIEHCHNIERFLKGNIWVMDVSTPPSSPTLQTFYFVILF